MSQLDRIIGILTLFLIGIITLLLLRGDQTFPKVSSFEFLPKLQRANTSQLLFVFNRAMDKESVEQGLTIEPEVSGRFSWIGRKAAFTPDQPLASGSEYTITISGALDEKGKDLQNTFTETIYTSPRQMVYIGTRPDELKRLVLYNFATAETEILTPQDITVRQFVVHPKGEDIIFFGVRKIPENEGSSPTSVQELFQLNIPTRKLSVLSGSEYINTVFDLAPDGSFLALDRIQKNVGDIRKIWIKNSYEEEWQPFWRKQFGFDEIRISAYGKYLLGTDLEALGYVLVPQSEEGGEIQFLGNFARTFGFSPDGQKILFGENAGGDIFSRLSHFVVFDTSGTATKILEGHGRVVAPEFSADSEKLYFLMKEVTDPETQELNQTFQVFGYDLSENGETNDHLFLRQITDNDQYSVDALEVSPDGRMLLLERSAVTSTEDVFDPDMRIFEEAMNEMFVSSEIWTKDLDSGEEIWIEVEGRNVQWVP